MILTIVMIRPVNRTPDLDRKMHYPLTAKGFFLFVLFRKLELPIINDISDINRNMMRVCVHVYIHVCLRHTINIFPRLYTGIVASLKLIQRSLATIIIAIII